MAKSLSGQNFVPSKPKRHVKVMDHIPNRPMDGRSIVARKTLILLPMFKLLIASGVAVSAAVLASPAQADWYVNPELNVGVGLDSGVGSGILEGHVGYDFDNGAYVQLVLLSSSLTLAIRKLSSPAKLVSAAVLSTARFRLVRVTSLALVSRLVPNLASELWHSIVSSHRRQGAPYLCRAGAFLLPKRLCKKFST